MQVRLLFPFVILINQAIIQPVDGCNEGWTGPNCAYKLSETDLPPWATDNNTKTCFNSRGSKSTSSIRVELDKPQHLTSVYLQFGSNDKVENLQPTIVQYTTAGDNSTTKCLLPRTMHLIDPRGSFVEIYCPDQNNRLATSLTLSGESVQSLCSVHISAEYHRLPVVMTNELGHQSKYTNEIWITTFEYQPVSPNVTIHGFNLYPDNPSKPVLSTCEDLVVEFRDAANIVLERIIIASASSSKLRENTYYDQMMSSILRSVRKINVTCAFNFNLDTPNITLTLLGVSECDQNDTFGESCNHSCNCDHRKQCSASGQCPNECFPGFMGPKCNIACSDGTYGPGCKKSCNTNCGHPCDRRTGLCTYYVSNLKIKPDSFVYFAGDNSTKPKVSASSEGEGYSHYMTVVVVGGVVMMSLLFLIVGSYMRNRNAAVDQNSSGQTKSADTGKSGNSIWGSGVSDDGEDLPHVSDLDSMSTTGSHTPIDRRSIDTNVGSIVDSKTS